MYHYIYDTFLKEKKFEKIRIKIETRLTDLGLNGKIVQVSIFNNAKELVKDAILNGAQTIVIVGNDQLLTQIINVVGNHENIILGMIPVGSRSKISKIFGVPSGLTACDTLSSRIIKTINLGKINNDYFLDNIVLPFQETSINFDEKYSIKTSQKNQTLTINNLYQCSKEPCLEAIIQHKENKKIFNLFSNNPESSVFNIKKAVIANHSVPITIDDQRVIKTPALIEVVPNKLRVIVGKNRKI